MRVKPTSNPTGIPPTNFDDESIKRREKYQEDIEKRRESARKSYRKRKSELRNALFDILGRKCIRCGFDDIRALQFDHINGGGTEKRKKSRNHRYYKFMLEDPELTDNIQVLCANCNWIKLIERNEWASIQ